MEQQLARIVSLVLDLATAWDLEGGVEGNRNAVLVVVKDLGVAGALTGTYDDETHELTVDPTKLVAAANLLILHFATLLAQANETSVHTEREPKEPTEEMHAATYRAAGLEPSWDVVWRQGVDVTHEDPASWPWPWSMCAAGGRGDRVRAEVWALHRAAIERHANRDYGVCVSVLQDCLS